MLIYFASSFALESSSEVLTAAMLYIVITSTGSILLLTGGILLFRVIQLKIYNPDIFNRENKTFPQEERKLENEYSINLPARYYLKGKIYRSWINVINPFRSFLVRGSPGSGKSYFVIRHAITRHINKGFVMFVYDFKFDDLSQIAYNTWLKRKHLYQVIPQFYVINFDDLTRSHRCKVSQRRTRYKLPKLKVVYKLLS